MTLFVKRRKLKGWPFVWYLILSNKHTKQSLKMGLITSFVCVCVCMWFFFLLSLFVTLYIFLRLTVMHSSTFGKGWVGMSACPLVVLACESLHVCTVCIWHCEHARFCVEVFYALYINFHSFIHSNLVLLAAFYKLTLSDGHMLFGPGLGLDSTRPGKGSTVVFHLVL